MQRIIFTLALLVLSVSSVARPGTINQGFLPLPEQGITAPSTSISTSIGFSTNVISLFNNMGPVAPTTVGTACQVSKIKQLSGAVKTNALIACYQNGYSANALVSLRCSVVLSSEDEDGNLVIADTNEVDNCKIEKKIADDLDWLIWKARVEAYNKKGQDNAFLLGFTQKVQEGDQVTSVELTRMIWKVSDKVQIPFYIITNDEEKGAGVKAGALDNDSGLFNIKVAGHKMVLGENGDTFCDHSSDLMGGCYYGFETGLKFDNAPSDFEATSKTSIYGSLYFDMETSILNAKTRDRAGMVKFGIAVNVAKNDKDLIEEYLVQAGKDVSGGVDDHMAYIRFYMTANIDNYMSISAGYVPLSTDSVLNESSYFSINYQAAKFN